MAPLIVQLEAIIAAEYGDCTERGESSAQSK